MAIDRIQNATVIGPADSADRLMQAIHRLGVMEVMAVSDASGEGEGVLSPRAVSTDPVDETLHKVGFILNLLDLLAPEHQGFLEGLAPLPLVVEQQEVDRAVETFDLEGQFGVACALDEAYRNAQRSIAEMLSRMEEWAPLQDLPFRLKDMSRPQRTRLVFGHMPEKNLDRLAAREGVWPRVAWEVIKGGGAQRGPAGPVVRVVFAFLREDEEAVRKALADIEFEEVALPDLPGRLPEHLRELEQELAACEARRAEVVAKVGELAGVRRTVQILRAYWLSQRKREVATGNIVQGKWVHLLRGRVRALDVPRLTAALREEFPESMLVTEEPGADEDVPVALTLPRWLQPLQLLVDMFGRPHYRGFDPSPFLFVNFYVFFGICFSDVGYGVMLVLFSAYLSSKTKAYSGVNRFARILLYAGGSTIIFGILSGSWFGDLYRPEFFGEGNPLQWLKEHLMVLDPMEKPVEALVIALIIGMANQFYGVILRAYGALRQGDWVAALCDGLLWLVTLPGLVIMATKLFMDIPPGVFRVGMWMFLLGALGLVLSQGRGVKNPVGRLAVGLVSLYGIVGTYGCTAFIGDTLSYGRLLALGLTTSIVAQTFNMMALMVRDVPVVGIVLMVLLLVVGHIFNFMVSLLGAFVHSMRLIYVEFFGRFYEGGARPFEPLGFDSPLCIVRKTSES